MNANSDKTKAKHCPGEVSGEALLYWRNKNLYYYRWLERIYKFVVRPNSRILHLGCGLGHFLNELKPSYGLGIDENEENIRVAGKLFPELKFINSDYINLKINDKFDYIIVSSSLGGWKDIQSIFDNMHLFCKPETRIIITYYSHLWEVVLQIGSLIGLRRPYKYQNWLPQDDITNFLYLSDFDVISTDSYLMFPINIPVIASFFNYFLSLLPGFKWLNLINLIIARPVPQKINNDAVSVSVIVPCRNEKGNIEEAVKRIPKLGKETEIVFVEGNSKDGTAEEIQKQITNNPDKRIILIHQGNGVGKGDAVRKGFKAASGDVFVIQDADLTAPPEDLPKFLKVFCEGKGEFINGSRLVYPMEKQAMRFLNLIGNKFFGKLFTWLLGQRFRDTLCGTKMISKKNYEIIEKNRDYFGNFDPFGDFDLIFGSIKQNLKVAEVPVSYKARTYGETNIDRFRNGLLLFRMSWIAFKKIKWIG